MLDASLYALRGMDTIETPQLVYYRDLIEANTRYAISLAGDAGRLWPHVKSHKMADMIRMQMDMGIRRFKCATIAEAQMVAECGAAHAAIAYPLVGPNIARFAVLMRTYPDTTFYAIGDDITQLSMLSDHLSREGLRAGTLIDVNMGMNRTGTPLEDVQALYAQCAAMDGLSLCGLHCYDGHLHDPDLDTRIQRSQAATDRAFAICDALRKEGHACEILIMGGTPTFPVHARHKGVFLSPGTIFLSDIKCLRNAGDLKITPAAGIWTRVVSHPAPGQFTLDLGSKGISTDQADGRGVIAGLEAAQPLFQSEEHWVWKMPEGEPIPAIGDMFFVVPLHICPATALYPFALVASGGEIVTRWDVTARNRNIGI